jgi:hypothetical protein
MIHSAKKIIISLSAALLLSGIPAENLQAQAHHATSVSTALGGGGSSYITGYHANFVNPANLMISDRNTRVNVGIIGGIHSQAGGSLVNIGLYNKHFTNGHTIDTEKALQISDEWFGTSSHSTSRAGFGVDVVPLGASYRRDDMAFSVAARARTLGHTGLSKGMFELALTGLNTEVFQDPKKVDFSTELLAMWELSFGFAMEVWRSSVHYTSGSMRVFAGAAPKVLFGMGYAKMGLESQLQVIGRGIESTVIHEFEYYILTNGNLTDGLADYHEERRIRGNKDAVLDDFLDDDSFSDLGSRQGTGFGMDLGATFEWYMRDVSLPVIGAGPQILRASLAITDLGAINFRRNPGDFRAQDTFFWEGLNIDFEYIDEEFDGDFSSYLDYVLEDSIGSDIYGNFSPRDVSNHRVGLTPMIHIGGSLTMGRLGVMLDVGKGTNNRGVNSRRLYAALGTEYRILHSWPLRIGMRAGGYSGVNLSAGTGLDFRNFEFSVGAMTTPSSSRGGMNLSAAWSGLVFRF